MANNPLKLLIAARSYEFDGELIKKGHDPDKLRSQFFAELTDSANQKNFGKSSVDNYELLESMEFIGREMFCQRNFTEKVQNKVKKMAMEHLKTIDPNIKLENVTFIYFSEVSKNFGCGCPGCSFEESTIKIIAFYEHSQKIQTLIIQFVEFEDDYDTLYDTFAIPSHQNVNIAQLLKQFKGLIDLLGQKYTYRTLLTSI